MTHDPVMTQMLFALCMADPHFEAEYFADLERVNELIEDPTSKAIAIEATLHMRKCISIGRNMAAGNLTEEDKRAMEEMAAFIQCEAGK